MGSPYHMCECRIGVTSCVLVIQQFTSVVSDEDVHVTVSVSVECSGGAILGFPSCRSGDDAGEGISGNLLRVREVGRDCVLKVPDFTVWLTIRDEHIPVTIPISIYRERRYYPSIRCVHHNNPIKWVGIACAPGENRVGGAARVLIIVQLTYL